jgi:KICSTOR complex protein ITFG2
VISDDKLQIYKSHSEIQYGISSLPEYVRGGLDFNSVNKSMISANTEGMISVHSTKNHENKNTWSMDLNQEIVGVSKEKFADTSTHEELCVCTWDGMTFIIDSEKNMVLFNFKDRVCAFSTGYYSISKDEKVLCIF